MITKININIKIKGIMRHFLQIEIDDREEMFINLDL